MSDEPGLDDAYSLDGPDDVRELYGRWANTFETGFIVEMGYVYHQHVVAKFVDLARDCHVSGNEIVLDVGCGTGIVGVDLRQYGAWPIDGLDLSPEMLTQAAAKESPEGVVYRRLIEANVLKPLPMTDNAYGGAISVGTFTHGHVGPEAIDELVRVVRPGGAISIGVNEAFYNKAGFDSYLDQLHTDGHITKPILAQVRVYELATGSNPHADDTALLACFSPT